MEVRLYSFLNINTNAVIAWKDREENGQCLAPRSLVGVVGGEYRTGIEEVLFSLLWVIFDYLNFIFQGECCNFLKIKVYN